MAVAVPQFYLDVVGAVNLLILVVSLVLEIFAFLHCVRQRADAFGAIGTLSKGAWLGLIGGTLLLSLLFRSGALGLFSLIAIGVALVYILDVRPALRDVSDGRGPW